jgi:hypothetical protein
MLLPDVLLDKEGGIRLEEAASEWRKRHRI